MKTVMAFGTFDLLHPGHRAYLKQAKALGDRLVVVIARDANVLKIKGKQPIHDEKTRRAAVTATELADDVVLGDPNDFFNVLRTFGPDIIALGYDQRVDLGSLKKNFPAMEIVRLEPFKPEKYKSSLMNVQKGSALLDRN